jgi:hypothetical protein
MAPYDGSEASVLAATAARLLRWLVFNYAAGVEGSSSAPQCLVAETFDQWVRLPRSR